MENTGIVAIKKFLERDSLKISMAEMSEFWKSLTDDEKTQFAEQANELTKNPLNMEIL